MSTSELAEISFDAAFSCPFENCKKAFGKLKNPSQARRNHIKKCHQIDRTMIPRKPRRDRLSDVARLEKARQRKRLCARRRREREKLERQQEQAKMQAAIALCSLNEHPRKPPLLDFSTEDMQLFRRCSTRRQCEGDKENLLPPCLDPSLAADLSLACPRCKWRANLLKRATTV